MWQVFQRKLKTLGLWLNYFTSVVLDIFLEEKVLKILFLYLCQPKYQGIECKFWMEFKDKILLQNKVKIMVENLRTTMCYHGHQQNNFWTEIFSTLKTKFYSCCCPTSISRYCMEIPIAHMHAWKVITVWTNMFSFFFFFNI